MDFNTTISPNLYRAVKCESDHDNIDRLKNELIQQKEDYEQQLIQLQKAHEEQICKFCNELEKSSTLLHEYKLELDVMRLELQSKETQLKNQSNDSSSNENSLEVIAENTQLKKDVTALTTKYQMLTNEIQDARQYIIGMIASLE